MSIFQRIKQIMKANINHMIDESEDPEKMIKQLIRDMDANIIQLRMEVAKAIATEKRLERRMEDAKKSARNWRMNAEKAVDEGDDELARKALASNLHEEKKLEEYQSQHQKAQAVSKAMKDQLKRLEDKIQEARRKKEILIARKRTASAQTEALKSAQNIRDASGKADSYMNAVPSEGAATFDSVEDKIIDMEAEAEALHELAQRDPSLEETFDLAQEEDKVNSMLKELKKKSGK